MIPRVRSAGIALCALLAAASPCLAAEGLAPGRGAIGGQLGGSSFWADGDYSEGARARFGFSAHFRYVINNRLRWQISPGFTWTGYSGDVAAPVLDGRYPEDVTKRTYLTLLLPMTFEMQVLLHRGRWHYHVGAGPGAYRVSVENRHNVIIDPVTFAKHVGLYPGVTGEIGVERFVKSLPSTSLEACVATHWVFADGNGDFPAGYNNFLAATEIRIGANYYFDMSRLAKKKPDQLPPSAR
jgi:hypothetical protein